MFLKDYLEFAANDESPEMFHVWCAYSALSSVIGRRVWLPRAPNFIYCNIYTMFVANAGGGKSWAMSKFRNLITEAGILPSASVETVEGIIRKLAGPPPNKGEKPPSDFCEMLPWPDGQIRETHSMTIVANEFIDFIRSNPEVWTGFLCNIYDQDFYSYDTKNSGSDRIIGPYIVFVGAIPTDVSKKLQEFDIINTGLARRTLMQYGERRFDNPVPRPSFTADQAAARKRCLARLKQIKEFRGPFTETPEACEYYDAWYRKHSRGLAQRATAATLGWLSSKPMQVVKLAMLNSLACRDDLTIIAEDFEVALLYLEQLEESMNMVFGGVGRNELAPITMMVLNFLRRATFPHNLNSIYKEFFHSWTAGKGLGECQEILNYLCAMDFIQKRSITTAGISGDVYATEAVWQSFDAARRSPPSDGAASG